MNHLRVITGVVVALVVALFVFIGGLTFSLSISFVAALSLREFYRLTIPNFSSFKNSLFIVLGLFNSVILILMTHVCGISALVLMVSFNIVTTALLSITVFNNSGNHYLDTTVKQICGFVYIAIPLSLLVITRNYNYGFLWSIMIISSISAGDIGAYYVGSSIGKYKLCPNISPNKTLEGSIGGLLCSIIVTLTFKFYLLDFAPVINCVIFACILGIVSQAGDLFVSEFKRSSGLKDSGSFLPGHGGFLDRIDAFLLAMPVAYLFRFYIVS